MPSPSTLHQRFSLIHVFFLPTFWGVCMGVWRYGGHHCWLLYQQEDVPSPGIVEMEAGCTAQVLVGLESPASREASAASSRCFFSVWAVTLCWKTKFHFSYSSPLIWCWVFLQWGWKQGTCPFLSVLPGCVLAWALPCCWHGMGQQHCSSPSLQVFNRNSLI